MTRPELLKKLEATLDEMAHKKAFGTIELEIRDGAPILIRRITTEKIEGDRTHADRNFR